MAVTCVTYVLCLVFTLWFVPPHMLHSALVAVGACLTLLSGFVAVFYYCAGMLGYGLRKDGFWLVIQHRLIPPLVGTRPNLTMPHTWQMPAVVWVFGIKTRRVSRHKPEWL